MVDKVATQPTAKDGLRNDKMQNTGRMVDRLVQFRAASGYNTTSDSRQRLTEALSDLSFCQTSVAILLAAGLGAVTADGKHPTLDKHRYILTNVVSTIRAPKHPCMQTWPKPSSSCNSSSSGWLCKKT